MKHCFFNRTSQRVMDFASFANWKPLAIDKKNWQIKFKETWKDWQKGRGQFPEICFPKIIISFPSYSLALENNCTFKTGWSDDSRFPHAWKRYLSRILSVQHMSKHDVIVVKVLSSLRIIRFHPLCLKFIHFGFSVFQSAIVLFFSRARNMWLSLLYKRMDKNVLTKGWHYPTSQLIFQSYTRLNVPYQNDMLYLYNKWKVARPLFDVLCKFSNTWSPVELIVFPMFLVIVCLIESSMPVDWLVDWRIA